MVTRVSQRKSHDIIRLKMIIDFTLYSYWDWTKHSSDPTNDPMWSPVTGFGGNGSPDHQQKIGRWNYSCVVDGPFKDLRPSYLQSDYAPHCLTRDFNNGTDYTPGNMFGPSRSPEKIAEINAYIKYTDFHPNLENIPHGSVHSSVGGDMSPATSPNGQFDACTSIRC